MQQVKLKLALIVTGALAAISLLALPSACGGGSAASGDLNIAGVVQASTSTPASPTAPVKATVLSSGLSSPWGMAFLPDGRMVVTQKAGTMVIVSANGTTVSASFSPGLPNLTSTGQGGLLDVVIDPDFNLATNPRIYWAFSETGAGVLALPWRIVLSADSVASKDEVPMVKALGQRIRVVKQGPDGWIYLLTDAGTLVRVER